MQRKQQLKLMAFTAFGNSSDSVEVTVAQVELRIIFNGVFNGSNHIVL